MASIRPPEYPFADGPGNIVWTLRLFCSADLVAGSRFTVLGRR